MTRNLHTLRIFSGTANPHLAEEVANHLNRPLGRIGIRKLPDSEIHILIEELVREDDVFIIQPCSEPVNDNLMELILTIDAFRRASAHNVNVLIPYFPYARQDRMARGREPISARVVATMLETIGASRVIYVDIHAEATQGFFTVPVDPLSAMTVFAEHIQNPGLGGPGGGGARCGAGEAGRAICPAAGFAPGAHAQTPHQFLIHRNHGHRRRYRRKNAHHLR